MDENNISAPAESAGASAVPGGARRLNYASGLVRYQLTDDFSISFNPTDSVFFEQILDAFDALEGKQASYQTKLEQAEPREIFAIARRRDQEMRTLIDEALGAGVCDAAFGGMSVCALADGFPVWANLLLAIVDECDATVAAEQKKTNPRLEKYTKKYRRK